MRNLTTLFLMAHFCAQLAALSSSADKLLDFYFPENKNSGLTQVVYSRLRFLFDEATTTCQKMRDILVCKTHQGAEIKFSQISIPKKTALALLRKNRKEAWAKEYPGLNQYDEEPIKILAKPSVLQQAVYFRFDNINWPVLLRSYDVVIDDKTIINVTTACDVRLWPANIEIIKNLERSINKSAN